MRRTRRVALPVRAWRYVGLLVVSLACLTVGLVSRDKEGRAGSLAGPELEHRAPHEVDACPNLAPLAAMPSPSKPERDQTSVSQGNRETSRISRSRSADRVSQIRTQYRADLTNAERQERIVRIDHSRRTLRSTVRSTNDGGRRETSRRATESRGREIVRRSWERQVSTNSRRENRNERSNRDHRVIKLQRSVDPHLQRRTEDRLARRVEAFRNYPKQRLVRDQSGERSTEETSADRKRVNHRIRIVGQRMTERTGERLNGQRTEEKLDPVPFEGREKRLDTDRSIGRLSIRKDIRLSRLPNQRGHFGNSDMRSTVAGDSDSSRFARYLPTMKTLGIVRMLDEKDPASLAATFKVVRQVLVTGLCTMYGLTIFYGKQSFVRNLAPRVPRFIPW